MDYHSAAVISLFHCRASVDHCQGYIKALQLVRSMNLRVPEDVNTIGYDNITVTDRTNSPLSSMDCGALDVDRLAPRVLGRLTDGGEISGFPCHLIKPRSIEKASCRGLAAG